MQTVNMGDVERQFEQECKWWPNEVGLARNVLYYLSLYYRSKGRSKDASQMLKLCGITNEDRQRTR